MILSDTSTLRTLTAARARIHGVLLETPADYVVERDDLSEAIHTLDDAIVEEVRAVNANDSTDSTGTTNQ